MEPSTSRTTRARRRLVVGVVSCTTVVVAGATIGAALPAAPSGAAAAPAGSASVTTLLTPGVPVSAPGVWDSWIDGVLVVGANAGSNDGGSPLIGFVFEVRRGDVVIATHDELYKQYSQFEGLIPGERYTLVVAAVNAYGRGPWSAPETVVLTDVPAAPGIARVTPGDRSVTVALTPPASGGAPITGYTVRVRSGATVVATKTAASGESAPAPTVTVTGLARGATYAVDAAATNALGQGPWSGPRSVTLPNVASAVRSLTATPGSSGQVRLAWVAPASNGGPAITDYVIQRSATGTSGWTTINDGVRTTTSYTVTGLSNGTRYYFRVLATNALGAGPASNVANQIPRTVPSAPRLRATPGAARVALTWTAPTSTGGSPITRYAIQRSTRPTSGWVSLSSTTRPTTRSFTATGLRRGTRYYFRIVAINAAGQGAWSPTVSAVPR